VRRLLVAIGVILAFASCVGSAEALPTQWGLESAPALGGSAYLSSVSCTSATTCMAVGELSVAPGRDVYLAEQRTSGGWALTTIPTPTGLALWGLTGVSCTSANACLAVGYGDSVGAGASQTPDALFWNGTSWVDEPPLAPTPFTPLSGVSCPTAGFCMVVGSVFNPLSSHRFTGLAETWSNGNWTEISVPASDSLNSVSCTSSTACTAVGSSGSGESLLARWNGSTWTVQSQASATDNLLAVSCSAGSSCTAVGETAGSALAAERWSGTTWTASPTPAPSPAATSAEFDATTCALAGSVCEAIGAWSGAAGVGGTVAERWVAGAWHLQTSPTSSSPTDLLTGVSCGTSRVCEAVGYTGRGSSTQSPLVERLADTHA
jgi:hypothetical protein